MVKSLIGVTFNGIASTANTTQYWPFVGEGNVTTTETQAQILLEGDSTITMSKLLVKLSANSVNATSTFRTRKNAANATMTLSVGANATGTFEDTTNTDGCTANDKYCLQTTPGAATGTYTFRMISVIHDCGAANIQQNVSAWTLGAVVNSQNSTTRFVTLQANSNNGTTEANQQIRVRKAGTMKNLHVNVGANARVNNTTFKSRKNQADGSQTMTIGSGATGWFEDSTNTDTVAAGDNYNAVFNTGSGTQSLTYYTAGVYFTNSNRDGLISSGRVPGAVTINANVTDYPPLIGRLTTGGLGEATAQLKTRMALTASNLSIFLATNTITATSTLNFRKNGANGNQTVSIGSSATGWFTDTTNTDSMDDDDLINAQIITGTTGTSMTVHIITVWLTSINAVAKTLATETTSISEASYTRLLAKQRPISTQTTAISESGTRLTGKQRPIAAQTTTISEVSLVRVKGKVKSPATETVTVGGGTLARLNTKNRSISETVTKAETSTRLKASMRPIATQTVTVGGGTLARIKGAVKALGTESVAIGEALARLSAKIRARNETVVITENRARLKGAMRSLATQTTTISENVARVVARQVTRALATQSVVISENLGRLKSALRANTENVPKAEALARIKAANRSLGDTVPKAEQLARIKSSLRTIALQTVSASESILRLTAKIRTLAQTVAITDSVIIEITGEIVRQITQTVDIAEQVVRLVTKARPLSVQTVAITDSVAAAKIREVVRALTVQTVAISESIVRLAAKQRISIENITLPSTLERIAAKARILSTESQTVSDSVTTTTNQLIKHIVRTITETTQILEQLLNVTDKWRLKHRRIVDPSHKRIKSNHPAWLLGTRGPATDHWEEF